MATLVHAYLLVKLLLMAVFLVAATIEFVVRRNRIVVYPRILTFYLCIAVAGMVESDLPENTDFQSEVRWLCFLVVGSGLRSLRRSSSRD